MFQDKKPLDLATDYCIRIVESPDDLKALKELVSYVWGMKNQPATLFHLPKSQGGINLGAFFKGKLVGLSYGHPCMEHGRTCFHLKKTAVHPDYRLQGLAFALRSRVGEIARDMGYHRIRSVFDPLETSLARFYFGMGCIGVHYMENHHGYLNDDLNQGLPTDRVLLEWLISSHSQAYSPSWPPMHKTSGSHLLDVRINSSGWPVPTKRPHPILNSQNKALLIVPHKFQALKKVDPSLAAIWRETVRDTFKKLIKQKFQAIHFRWDAHVGYYLFTRRTDTGGLNQVGKGSQGSHEQPPCAAVGPIPKLQSGYF